MALMPTERMGPPPGASPPMRMIASWSGSNDPTVYKSVAGRCRQWRAPLGDRHRPDAEAMQKAPVAVHHRSACSGIKRCETQAPLGGKPPSFATVRSLDPFRALREPDRRRRDEERLSRSEQRTGNKPKRLLDRKSPIQVRCSLPFKEDSAPPPKVSVLPTWV